MRSRYISKPLRSKAELEASATDRQSRVEGFSQAELNTSVIAMVGAGGIGSEIGRGLARKGVGRLKIFDADTVELSNLNRQYYFEEDLYKNKAERLGKNLLRECTCRTVIEAYPFMFHDAVESEIDLSCSVAVCGVDNDRTRMEVAEYFHKRGIPVIFIAVSDDANNGYVFIQEPGGPCFGCFFGSKEVGGNPCPGTPAMIDILKVVAGFTLPAIDSLLMDRKVEWNYRRTYLDGFAPSSEIKMEKREDCRICGKDSK